MGVGILDYPETEYWFRIKRENKKSVKDLESEICVYVSINLSHKSRKISCSSILMWASMIRLENVAAVSLWNYENLV